MLTPYPHQLKAVEKLHNGSILVSPMGAGKSLTALFYFWKIIGGGLEPITKPTKQKDLYIITTAKKRNDFDWARDCAMMGLGEGGYPGVEVTIDSWNNVKKYVDVSNAFFIFDEQKSVGSGTWSKSLIKISKKNQWMMLSATPGDRWIDYVTVFVANGLYANRTEFIKRHVIYHPHVTFPLIRGYLHTNELEAKLKTILVEMPYARHTSSHIFNIKVGYDRERIKEIIKTEWNPFTDLPIRNDPEHRAVNRKIINSHPSRVQALRRIHSVAEKLIIFYNFNFELEAMRESFGPITDVAEYNGQNHHRVPSGDNWVYLVQYMAGNEAWECTTTNHLAMYSLNYSYRIATQSMGRINRMNTPFKDLYFYRLISESTLDKAILKAQIEKKDFNERSYKIYI